jgi:hypothetical protein
VSVVAQVASFALWRIGENNYPILHLYTLLEYFTLIKFFSQILKGFIPKSIFSFFFYSFPLFSISDSLLIESIFSFNTYSRSIEAFILMTMCICWFIKIAGEPEDERQRLRDATYFIAGFFIYFSSSVILFAYSSYIKKMAINAILNVWTIHTFLLVQLYIFLSIGLWKARAK